MFGSSFLPQKQAFRKLSTFLPTCKRCPLAPSMGQSSRYRRVDIFLVGGWTNPSEKYDRQYGKLPQIGVKIKNIWNHQLVSLSILQCLTGQKWSKDIVILTTCTSPWLTCTQMNRLWLTEIELLQNRLKRNSSASQNLQLFEVANLGSCLRFHWLHCSSAVVLGSSVLCKAHRPSHDLCTTQQRHQTTTLSSAVHGALRALHVGFNHFHVICSGGHLRLFI